MMRGMALTMKKLEMKHKNENICYVCGDTKDIIEFIIGNKKI